MTAKVRPSLPCPVDCAVSTPNRWQRSGRQGNTEGHYPPIALVTRHGIPRRMPGPPPGGDQAATPAERSAAYRARRKATVAAAPTKPPAIVRYRRPADRRSRPQQWADAVQTLADLLDRFQEWRDNLPSSLANSATAEALDAVLELRGYVEELQAVDLPKGFGRD